MKILLDYDNTICNFSQMMCNKWNNMGEPLKSHPLYIEDIKYYSLHKCLKEKGYKDQTINFCLSCFWYEEDLYQKYYIDMPCRNEILNKILLDPMLFMGHVTLHTMCCSNQMAISKLECIRHDYDLLKRINDIKVDVLIDKTDYIKDTNYDVVIDDNPDFILKFLNDNPEGKAIVPRWCYNDIPGINDNDRVIMID